MNFSKNKWMIAALGVFVFIVVATVSMIWVIDAKIREDNSKYYVEPIVTETYATTATMLLTNTFTKMSTFTPMPTRTIHFSTTPTQQLSLTFVLQIESMITMTPIKNCCTTCKVGKACGDGCIAADKVCSKPVGCACNK